jgi:hypothetical protein
LWHTSVPHAPQLSGSVFVSVHVAPHIVPGHVAPSVGGGVVSVPLVSSAVPSVPLPSVPLPSVLVPSVPLPSVPPPSVPLPSLELDVSPPRLPSSGGASSKFVELPEHARRKHAQTGTTLEKEKAIERA